ncbi:TPA: hypothetical protein ACH3X2_002562 [Trebouxia sp. C0005]
MASDDDQTALCAQLVPRRCIADRTERPCRLRWRLSGSGAQARCLSPAWGAVWRQGDVGSQSASYDDVADAALPITADEHEQVEQSARTSASGAGQQTDIAELESIGTVGAKRYQTSTAAKGSMCIQCSSSLQKIEFCRQVWTAMCNAYMKSVSTLILARVSEQIAFGWLSHSHTKQPCSSEACRVSSAMLLYAHYS